MKPHRISPEVSAPLELLYIGQLTDWPLCRDNYAALNQVERREFSLGDFRGFLQYNPARRRSTAAKTDAASIASRPCFLCKANRPAEQAETPLDDDFDILVNPFPIFPLHLTIAARRHRPQAQWPDAMIPFVESRHGVAAFYNGARAGASAPDHLHFQAAADCELPLIDLCERFHTLSMGPLLASTDMNADLPFGFFSFIITPDSEGLALLRRALAVRGFDIERQSPDTDLLNVFVWTDDSRRLRIAAIPRKAHRPACFFAQDDTKRCVSPGAVDMAGGIIVPDKHDFDTLSEQELRTIYSQTAFTPEEFDSLRQTFLP